MITIITTPKPFKDPHITIIQRNAILSWKKSIPGCQIILFGDEQGIEEFAKEIGVICVKDVKKNEFGTPLVNDIFEKAQAMSRNDVVAYVNADIILMSDFGETVKKYARSKFLLIGHRTDMDVKEPVDFENANWEKNLRKEAEERGKLHGHSGIDYFVFPRGLFDKIPPFALGRGVWDSWLLYSAWLKTSLVDATNAITAVHQNHDYSHIAGSKRGYSKGPEGKNNLRLGGEAHLFTIRDADFIITGNGLEKPEATVRSILFFPYHNFGKADFWFKIILFPGLATIILMRKIKRFLK